MIRDHSGHSVSYLWQFAFFSPFIIEPDRSGFKRGIADYSLKIAAFILPQPLCMTQSGCFSVMR